MDIEPGLAQDARRVDRGCTTASDRQPMSVLVWVLIGIAIWHAAVLVPDRIYGGIVGTLVAAVAGALAFGYLLPEPGVSAQSAPGLAEALWPIPGALLALLALYWYGRRAKRADDQTRSMRARARGDPNAAARPGGPHTVPRDAPYEPPRAR
jgi:uncharacterized membrane protein YeaQ/YmgE (transglycosylase-associated protein family)